MLKLLFILLVCFMSLSQFGAISKSGGFNLYLFDIGVFIFCLYSLFYFFNKHKFFIPKAFIVFFYFVAIAFFSLVIQAYFLNISSILVASFYLVRFTAYLALGLFVYNFLLYKDISLEFVLNALITFGVVLCVGGFIQLWLLPDFEVLDIALGWDPHKNRLASTFFDPNFLGAYLSILLAIAFYQYHEKRNAFVRFSLILFMLSIILTFSRSAWLMLGVIIFIYGVFISKKVLFVALVVFFLAYYTVPRVQTRIAGITDPSDSAHFRLISWKNTLEIAKEHPLLGVGFNTFRYYQDEYGFIDAGTLGGNSGAGADSSLLFVLATTGVFGFVFYLLSFLYPIYKALSNKNLFNVLFAGVLLGLLLNSQFINSLFYPQIMMLLFVLVGVCEYLRTSS